MAFRKRFMSVSLDFALFMRNSKTKLGLSLSARAIIYTLAFRIGSRPNTWVSHNALALECGLHKQNLTDPIKKILLTNILKSKKNLKDKRKSLYAFNSMIKNYHQMTDKDKIKVHEYFDDIYAPPICKSKSSSGKPEQSSLDSSGKPELYSSGKPEQLLNEKSPETHVPQGLAGNENSPKAPEETTMYKQRNRATSTKKKGSVSLTYYSNEFFPDEKRRQLLTHHAQRTNNSEHYLLEKFGEVSIKYKTRSKDWQKTFEDYLINEKLKRVYTNHTGGTSRYDGQSRHA
jgi:hypothetical protein